MPEAFGNHREKYAKPYARGTRKLMSAQRKFLEYLLDRLPQPIYTRRAAILEPPAFQAGGHLLISFFSMLFILPTLGVYTVPPEVDFTSHFLHTQSAVGPRP